MKPKYAGIFAISLLKKKNLQLVVNTSSHVPFFPCASSDFLSAERGGYFVYRHSLTSMKYFLMLFKLFLNNFATRFWLCCFILHKYLTESLSVQLVSLHLCADVCVSLGVLCLPSDFITAQCEAGTLPCHTLALVYCRFLAQTL